MSCCAVAIGAASLALASSEVEQEARTSGGFVVLEDFEEREPGSPPAGWEPRGWGDLEEVPYRVLEERGNRFLRAEGTGQNVILLKRVRWDLETYPYISWRWRIREVPEGADERYEETADSAAGLYLTYGRRWGFVPRSIKFVWSTRLPEGTALRRPGIGMPWTVVAGSGREALGRWRTFVYDAREAYRRTFGGEPDGRPLGIGILSDANNTGSRAFADYDDIRALESAEDVDTIREILVLGER